MSLGTEAGTVARQRLQFALGALEAQSAEAAEDARLASLGGII